MIGYVLRHRNNAYARKLDCAYIALTILLYIVLMAQPSLSPCPSPCRTPNCLLQSTALGGHIEEQHGHSLL